MKKLFTIGFVALVTTLTGCNASQPIKTDAVSGNDQPYACQVMKEHGSAMFCKKG